MKLNRILFTTLFALLNTTFAQNQMQGTTLKLGSPTVANKDIIFDINNGVSNPRIRANGTTDRLEFTNDGTLFKVLGSGSGGGGSSGINLLANPGFEDGATSSWTSSGGTYSEVISGSNLLFGEKSVTFQASATGQYFQSELITVPEILKGQRCKAHVWHKNGDNNLTIKVVDGSGVLIENASAPIAPSTVAMKTTVGFACPTSGSIRLKVESTAASAAVAFDQSHLGSDEEISISQAQFIGSAYFETTTSCNWSRGATTLGAFSAVAACPGPTVEFNPGPGVIQTTDTDLPQVTLNNLPPGEYEVSFQLTGGNSSAGSAQALAISDGTAVSGRSVTTNDAAKDRIIVGHFQYQQAGSRTFSLYGAASAGTITIDNTDNLKRTVFRIVRFPLASEQAIRVDTSSLIWAGYHDSTCSWPRTNTAYGDPTADATCALVERVNRNFGSVTSALSGADKLPGIVFTPPKTGTLMVCTPSYASPNLTAVGATIGVRLTDGTAQISESVQTGLVSTSYQGFLTCQPYNITTLASVTLKLESKASAGQITIGGNGGNAIEWSIFYLDNNFPAPLLVGSVTSSSNGIERVERATITNNGTACVIDRQSGPFAINTRPGTGRCSVTFSPAFSATPTCTCVAQFSATGGQCTIDGSGTLSGSSYFFLTASAAGTATDTTMHITCMGPK